MLGHEYILFFGCHCFGSVIFSLGTEAKCCMNWTWPAFAFHGKNEQQ